MEIIYFTLIACLYLFQVITDLLLVMFVGKDNFKMNFSEPKSSLFLFVMIFNVNFFSFFVFCTDRKENNTIGYSNIFENYPNVFITPYGNPVILLLLSLLYI